MGPPILDYFRQSEKHDDSDSGSSTDGDRDEDEFVGGEVDENPVMYCRLARPAFHRGEPQSFRTGEVPVAAGVCLRAYYRCPADIRGDKMEWCDASVTSRARRADLDVLAGFAIQSSFVWTGKKCCLPPSCSVSAFTRATQMLTNVRRVVVSGCRCDRLR